MNNESNTATAAYTPGEWTSSKVGNSARFEIISGNEIIGSFFASQNRATNEANAKLIAAAPDLLTALIELASGHSMAGEEMARKAISKAMAK